MPIETKLLLTCLVLIAAAFAYAVLRVTGAWYEHHVERHDLIAESKRRRFAYLKALADRDRELMAAEEAEASHSVIIEDDDEPVLAQAA
ncbi:MAG: hypothetical protein AB8C95_08910 [Phycisphaeraceae bacterium]